MSVQFGGVVMKMARTLSVAILCVVATLLIAAPAFAQFGGPFGGPFGGACGAPAVYGPKKLLMLSD
jgi:hypothetical protein